MGPGLGRDAETESLVRAKPWTISTDRMVLDADALDDRAYGGTAPRILTPHPGEMARLTGKPTAEIQKDRIGAARAYATARGVHAGAQGTTHTDRLPRRPRVDQPDRHARDGHRRHRRRAHGPDRGLSGAVSQSARTKPWPRRCICTAWPASWARASWAKSRSSPPIFCGFCRGPSSSHGGVCRRTGRALRRRPWRWARAWRGELPARGVVLLIGNLGAGKTMLAKGIVSGLGAAAPEEVSSPTFTLIHEYGRGPRARRGSIISTCTVWRRRARWPPSAWTRSSTATRSCSSSGASAFRN